MDFEKYKQLQENSKIRNKLLKLGICNSVVGPQGPKGDSGIQGPTGPTGPMASSSNEGLFFTSFIDKNDSGEMLFENSWFVPNLSEFFSLVSESEVMVQPGIYEITFSGMIENADDTHGAVFYIKDDDNNAIKDLYFELLAGNGKQMNFSQTIIFRFEKVTNLQVMVDIVGDFNTSNVDVTGVNLLMKKIHD